MSLDDQLSRLVAILQLVVLPVQTLLYPRTGLSDVSVTLGIAWRKYYAMRDVGRRLSVTQRGSDSVDVKILHSCSWDVTAITEEQVDKNM